MLRAAMPDRTKRLRDGLEIATHIDGATMGTATPRRSRLTKLARRLRDQRDKRHRNASEIAMVELMDKGFATPERSRRERHNETAPRRLKDRDNLSCAQEETAS